MSFKQLIFEGKDFFRQLYVDRILIFELTKRDFRTKYTQNLLGLAWAVIEPLAMMSVLWFVFSRIREHETVSDTPFLIYLLTGLVAIDFFSKTLHRGTKSIQSFSFLVRQVNFRMAVMPVILILSELIILVIVLFIVIVFLMLFGYHPSVYWLQVIYFVFAECFLLTGLSWLTSSIVLFFPDLNYIITISLRLLFFITPVFWQVSSLPLKYLPYFRFNPLFYLVEGFRSSFIYHKPFWNDLPGTIVFWIISLLIFILGIYVFKRLRPHFADVVY